MQFLLLLTILSAFSGNTSLLRGTAYLESSSRIYLEGTSNVKDFRCDCTQTFGSVSFAVDPVGEEIGFYFDNTRLRIENEKLDCGHRGMNRDMQATLKTDAYPHIKLQIITAGTPGPDFKATGACGNIPVKIAMTIAGKQKYFLLHVDAENRGNHRYRFQASFPLLLSSFDLTPPSPMLGLVKVSDQIIIHLDLWVRVEV